MVRWLALWTRGLRTEPWRSLGVAGLVLLTAAVATAVPRVLSHASDDALRGEVAAAVPTVRDLELVQVGRIAPAGDDPLAPVAAAGATLQARYPAPIPSLVSGAGVVIDTPHWRTTAGASLTAVVSLRIQQDVEAHLTLVDGRFPGGASQTIDDRTPGTAPGTKIGVLETAVSVPTATALAVAVGDRLILDPEPSDTLAAHRSVRLAIDIVGTYTVTDPADPFWIGDSDVARPGIYALTGFTEYVRAEALLAPAAYPALMATTGGARLPMTYRWRSYVEPSAIESSSVDALVGALRQARSVYPPVNPTSGPGALTDPTRMSPATLQTGLLGLLAAHQVRWQSGATILAIVWSGAGLGIIAGLALVAEVVARRRRAAMANVRHRGASRGQVGAGVLVESILLVIPALAGGTALAVALVPTRDPAPTLAVAAAAAVVAVGLMAGASLRHQDGGPRERRRGRGRAGGGRLVAEALVVGLAIGGAVLLRQRAGGGGPGVAIPAGTAAAGAGIGGAASAGADPFLAVAPALVGLATGIIAVRLLPIALDLAGSIAARGRGVVATLGLRRAARDGGVAAVLAVALTTSTVAAFASALVDRIATGATSAAWQEVGADFAMTGSAADLAAFRALHLPGVEATAAIATIEVSASRGGNRTAILVAPADVAAVASLTPADPALPAAMTGPAGAPLPALISSDAAGAGSAASNAIAVGDELAVRIGSDLVPLRIVAAGTGYPGLATDGPFVVISVPQLVALHPADVPVPAILLVRAPTLTLAGLRTAVADIHGLSVRGRADTEASLRGGPAVGAVSFGVLAGAVAVLLYGLLTIVLAIALDTAGRRRETARLGILGLSRRQAVALVAVEFVPAVVVGVVAGSALGLGLLGFVEPGLGLPAVLGVDSLGGTPPDVARLVLFACGTLALIGVTTLGSTLFGRQTPLAMSVRE